MLSFLIFQFRPFHHNYFKKFGDSIGDKSKTPVEEVATQLDVLVEHIAFVQTFGLTINLNAFEIGGPITDVVLFDTNQNEINGRTFVNGNGELLVVFEEGLQGVFRGCVVRDEERFVSQL